MPVLSNTGYFFALSGLLAVAVGAIGISGVKLADKHGRDIRIVWYLFSLSVVSALIIAGWASSTGAIDSHGSYQGRHGAFVNSVLTFMLDLNADVAVFCSLLALAVLPQVISYLLSGVFGCASDPVFVGKALSIFVWSVVKSFVVASGIFTAMIAYGSIAGWPTLNIRDSMAIVCFSLILLVISFVFLLMYRGVSFGGTALNKEHSLRGGRWLGAFRAWMTRKSSSRNAA